jgi:predicted RNA-binding protein with PUA-like domain
MNYWLMKSEPDEYSIDSLARAGNGSWDGVRNYQARNMIRDQMRPGDLAFFYHSSCAIPAIVGIMSITSVGYADASALDPRSPYYDSASTAENPRWYRVDVRFKRKLKREITLQELKSQPLLAGLPLIRRGNRLSVMPITAEHWHYILSLE